MVGSGEKRMMMKAIAAFGVLACCVIAPGVAHADPCTATLPNRAGDSFSGTVRYVGDGDSLCVGPTSDPRTWIEVRLGDFDAPELHSSDGARSKRFLEQVAQRARHRVGPGDCRLSDRWPHHWRPASRGGRADRRKLILARLI
jgi:hypothetical protein